MPTKDIIGEARKRYAELKLGEPRPKEPKIIGKPVGLRQTMPINALRSMPINAPRSIPVQRKPISPIRYELQKRAIPKIRIS